MQVRPLQDEDHLAGEADEEEGHPRRSRGGRGRCAAAPAAAICHAIAATICYHTEGQQLVCRWELRCMRRWHASHWLASRVQQRPA